MSQIWGDVTQLPSYNQDLYNNPGMADKGMFEALQKYAPDAIKAINAGLPETANSQLAAQQGVQEGYNKIGAENVNLADAYQRQLDPEFYKQRGNISSAIDKYLGSYDPSRLTPTEEAQIARGIGATGGNLMPTQQNTIRNAQTFGNAGTERWKNFGNAITAAANAIPSLKSGLQGFQTANTGGGATAANAAAGNALNANFGFSTSALGDIAGNTQAQISKAKDKWDKIKAGSPSSVLGGII